jgi:hypothetical protein
LYNKIKDNHLNIKKINLISLNLQKIKDNLQVQKIKIKFNPVIILYPSIKHTLVLEMIILNKLYKGKKKKKLFKNILKLILKMIEIQTIQI